MTIVKSVGLLALAAGTLLASIPPIAADQSGQATGSGRGTLKGGSDYEQHMRQSGMEGMSGMSGEHSMTADSQKKAKKKAAKKAEAAAKPPAQ